MRQSHRTDMVLRTRNVFNRTILRSPCYGARQLGKWPLGNQLHTQKEHSSGRCLINITCVAKVTKLIGLVGWHHFYHPFLSMSWLLNVQYPLSNLSRSTPISVPFVNLEFVTGYLGGLTLNSYDHVNPMKGGNKVHPVAVDVSNCNVDRCNGALP